MKIVLTKPLLTGLTMLVLAVPAAAKEKPASANAIPPAAVAWNPPADVGHGSGTNNGGNGVGHESHGNGNGYGHDGGPPMPGPGDPVSPTLPYGLDKRDELPPGLAKRDELPPGLAKRLN